MKKNPPTQSLLLVILRLVWGLISDCIDTFLVWLHLKHWPSIGPAQWNRRPRPDPQSQAWQRLIASRPLTTPCSHQGTSDTSNEAEAPQGHPTRVCPQCGANLP